LADRGPLRCASAAGFKVETFSAVFTYMRVFIEYISCCFLFATQTCIAYCNVQTG